MNVVIFLQNPWSPHYAGRVWPREYWLMALRKSRSGQRLRILEEAIGKNTEIWYDNANPRVGDNPDSLFPPDLAHIQKVLTEQKPKYVVACGRQAEKGVLQVGVTKHLIIVPHPSHRLLTNELYTMAGKLIAEHWEGAIALRQAKGHITTEYPNHGRREASIPAQWPNVR